MPVVKRLARVASNVLTLLAVVIFTALAIGPHTGVYRTLTVLSGSMAPGIPAGSVVAVVPTDPSQLTEGMVITYAIPVEDKRVVTHRVTDIIKGGNQPIIQTKGDANDSPDAWVAQLDGGPVWTHRVTVPYLGFGISFMRQPMVRKVSVLATPLLFLLVTLWQIWAGAASKTETQIPADAARRRRRRQPKVAPAAAWLVADALPARRRTAGAGVTVGVLLVATAAASVLFAAPALALFRSSISAQQTIATAQLATPTGVTTACSFTAKTTTVVVSWTAVSDGVSDGYIVERNNGTTTTQLGTVSGVNTVSFTDSGVPRGTYVYAVRSQRGGWSSAAASAPSLTVQNKGAC